MYYQSHSTIRNCKGKYPNSTWAKKGFVLGSVQIYQCPKTYIKKNTIGLIDLYDFHKTFTPNNFPFGEAPAWFVELAKVIENTRSEIEELKSNTANLRGGRNSGKV